MPAQGKHRRPKNNPLARRFVAAGTGGAALALPLFGATAAEAAPNATPNAAPAAAAKKAPASPVTYSVTAGDTLSEIAQDHGVSGGWQKLYEDNKSVVGDNPSLIRPGMKLTIGAKSTAAPASTERASRSTARPALAKTAKPAKPATYANNLDGWIKEALAIMAERGIPGSYEGIHRNILRESSGNPLAINNWDSNAAAGTPSKGLLQVIDPTFRAYHVPGTSTDPYDPVANITAACNYAADRYGSIDNVFGAY
ncbi:MULTISPECIES: LysM peptidoglycan-binding domain-containing protein [unclassified Streptomyces]|uniref:transglycosylase SLT domain-containing protein n=1 Tax=unclassified Streptomyces TaxID=2593676 RepID=UPI00339F3646